MRLRRSTLIIVAIILVVIIAAALTVLYIIGRNRLENRAQLKSELTQKILAAPPQFGIKESIQESFRPAYRTIPVIRTDVTEQAVMTSRTFYAQKQEVRTRIAAEVKKVLVAPGDKVKAGQVLAALYNETAAALLSQAKLDLELQLQKLARLIDPEAASINPQDVETLKLRIRQAEIVLELKELEVTKLTVTTPSGGRLVSHKVSIGDYVTSGQTVATLFDDSKVLVLANVAQGDVARVVPGMKATLGFGTGFPLTTGKVVTVGYEGMTSGRNVVVPVTIEVDNSQGLYKSGMQANVSIVVDAETSISVGGACAPATRVDVKSMATGVVSAQPAPEGSKVTGSQGVIKLSNRTVELGVEQAQNDLAIAKAALAKLLSPDLAAEQYDISAQALKVEQARLTLDSRQADLDSLTVKAPFAGVVTRVPVRDGDRLASGAGVLTVQDPAKLQVQVSMPEMYISKVFKGQQADVVFDSIPDTPYIAKVVAIETEGQAKEKSSTFEATVEIDKAADLKPGMLAKVTITTEIRENVLAIPQKLVVPVALEKVVTVLREDKKDFWKRKVPQTVVIETGITDGVLVEIRCGLDPDEELVVAETK